MAEIGTIGGGDAFGADDGSRIARAVQSRAVENKRGVTAVKGDQRLSQQRGARFLSGGSSGRCMNETGAVANDAGEKVEPMDAKVPKDEIIHGFEGRSGDPTVIPANLDMNAGDLADEAGIDRLTDIGEVRRPTTVLVDRELEPAPLRELDEFATVIELLHEWFLRQHVLTSVQRAPL